MLLGLVVILFLMRLGVERRPDAPDVPPDCAKASFALSTTRVGMGGPVVVTLTGAAGRTHVVGVDVEGFVRDAGGAWRPVPKAGAEPVWTTPTAMPGECRRSDYFAIPGPVGKHTATMYELTDRGAVFVQQEEIEVLERQP